MVDNPFLVPQKRGDLTESLKEDKDQGGEMAYCFERWENMKHFGTFVLWNKVKVIV